MMKAKEFTEKLRRTATEVKTFYLMGGFGQRLMKGDPDWYNKEYKYNKDHAQEIDAHKDTDPPTFGFDCVCMVKGVGGWGFEGDPSKPFGGSVYESNGVRDSSIERIAKECSGLSKDFSGGLVPGELVFLTGYGHVGVYIGDGLVVESTPAWKNGVQITCCANLGTVPGYPKRRWDEHGKCAFIDYTEETIDWESRYQELELDYDRAIREMAALRQQNDKLSAELETKQATLVSQKAELKAVKAYADAQALEATKAKQEAEDARAEAQKHAQEAAEAKEHAKAEEARVAKYKALRGDMNGDGKVNAKDALYLYKHTIAPEKYPLADIEEEVKDK